MHGIALSDLLECWGRIDGVLTVLRASTVEYPKCYEWIRFDSLEKIESLETTDRLVTRTLEGSRAATTRTVDCTP